MPAVSLILSHAISRIPPGRWGIAVSGGCDSVALLHLAHRRPGLELHAIHIDHETRQGQSTLDAEFVRDLCASMGVPLTSARRSELETAEMPANLQARYRAVRLALYQRTIREQQLVGILQAHHTDDQAETILMRLARGTGIEGLSGIPMDSLVETVRIFRPLLRDVAKSSLREFLTSQQLEWREDASNGSPKYRRNQVRQILSTHPSLTPMLLKIQSCFSRLADELEALAPSIRERVAVRELERLHPLVQLHAIRRWAVDSGSPADDLSLELLGRVRTMMEDMASGPSVCLPGGLEVRRRAGELIMRRSQRAAPTQTEPGSEDPS